MNNDRKLVHLLKLDSNVSINFFRIQGGPCGSPGFPLNQLLVDAIIRASRMCLKLCEVHDPLSTPAVSSNGFSMLEWLAVAQAGQV